MNEHIMTENELEEYEETYKKELKRMTNRQVVSLLVLNVRNQTQKTKKYGMTKRQVAHVEKLSINIMLLREELLERMNKSDAKD